MPILRCVRLPFIVSIFGLVIFLGGIQSALSQEVVLRLRSGDFTLEGTLIEFDGESYVIKSPQFGTMSVDAKKFDCTGNGCPKRGSLQAAAVNPTRNNQFGIHGSNTIGAQLMPSLIESYAESIGVKARKVTGQKANEVEFQLINKNGQKVASIDLQAHGSNTSFSSLIKGKAQIGMSSRRIGKKEETAMAQAGLLNMREVDHEHVVALDGIRVIVSQENPINSLSLDQIAKIFSGQITNWAQVGQASGKIQVYTRDAHSGTTDTFKSLVLKPRGLKISPSAKSIRSTSDLSDQIARDPLGIGYIGFAFLRNAKALSVSTRCGIEYAPTIFNIKTEEYPLSRRLFLYTASDQLTPHTKKLLKFALSEKAQEVVANSGYVNRSIETLGFNHQSKRLGEALHAPAKDFNISTLKNFFSDLKLAKRISTTFRFEASTFFLDNKAKEDIQILAHVITSGSLKGKQLILAGYADSSGDFTRNLSLSAKRAQQVKQALILAGGGAINPNNLIVKSYGEILPVSCNTTDQGRQRNRRVEVWVRD